MLRQVVFFIALVAGFCTNAWAQANASDGALDGYVLDPSGAAIVNAKLITHRAKRADQRRNKRDHQ